MYWNDLNSKYIDGVLRVAVNFPFNKPEAVLIQDLRLEQLIAYITSAKIKSVFVERMANFGFFQDLLNVEHVAIEFNLPSSKFHLAEGRGKKLSYTYDLSSLYDLKELRTLKLINNEQPFITPKVCVDLSVMSNLQQFCGDYTQVKNLDSASSLQTLVIDRLPYENLRPLKLLAKLDTLDVSFSKLVTLDGVSALSNLQCLYLRYNRNLESISALSSVSKTLKALRIENCSRIEDFSVLEDLDNLELLELSGSGALPSLSFLNAMKKLKTLILGMDVIDGDLSQCKKLTYVYVEKNRKHYNIVNTDLPKGIYCRGNESIPEWRRRE